MAKYAALIQIALMVFCLVDCIQTEPAEVRNLPKLAWIALIIIVPLVGSIAWLLAGRPSSATAGVPVPRSASRPTAGGGGGQRPTRPAAPRGPDDDPEFLQQLKSIDDEHERTLKQWEQDLREREQRLRDDPGGDSTSGPDAPGRS